ncbi:hypothetical protein IFM47457_01148 [Aspergillus lentulus]|nr:hypothetical protein IFM47457_01148 [Aspergillus lentulus]
MFSKNIWVENAEDGAGFAVWVTGQFWKGEPMQQKIVWGECTGSDGGHGFRTAGRVPGMVY